MIGSSVSETPSSRCGTLARVSFRAYIADTAISADTLLADWRWLVGPRFELWLVTTWGDALLRDRDDGSIHLLDTLEGRVLHIAVSSAAFEVAVASTDAQDEWLMAGLVDRQARLGVRPGKDECLGFKIHPVLGGGLDADNVEIQLVVVHFAITGQLHEQLKSLPSG